jgi:hypothetical protein
MPPASIASRFHVRDDAYAPLAEAGRRGMNHIFLKNGREIFFVEGLDANSENQTDGQIT